jgi:hypothetical protein
VKVFWTPAWLHLIRDPIFRWQVNTLSSVSILVMSISDRCSLLRRIAGDSVIVVEIVVQCYGVGMRNFKVQSSGRVHVADIVHQQNLYLNIYVYLDMNWQIC